MKGPLRCVFWPLFLLFLALCCTKGGRECVQRSLGPLRVANARGSQFPTFFFRSQRSLLCRAGTQLGLELIFQPSKESNTYCDCKLIVEEERDEIVEWEAEREERGRRDEMVRKIDSTRGKGMSFIKFLQTGNIHKNSPPIGDITQNILARN